MGWVKKPPPKSLPFGWLLNFGHWTFSIPCIPFIPVKLIVFTGIGFYPGFPGHRLE
jgi:hypothetical protein